LENAIHLFSLKSRIITCKKVLLPEYIFNVFQANSPAINIALVVDASLAPVSVSVNYVEALTARKEELTASLEVFSSKNVE
jgi:hypothetical protein